MEHDLPAAAHHGWGWAEDEQSTLAGTVQTISMAPPHPSLQVKAGDGVVFDSGHPEEKEEGGRVYQVQSSKLKAQSASEVALGFGYGAIDFRDHAFVDDCSRSELVNIAHFEM